MGKSSANFAAQLENTIEDLRKRLGAESAERQRLTLLIADQREREE